MAPDPRTRGQTVVLFAVFMMVLLGACALAIDVGSWYRAKQQLQSAADAAALAGASSLPAGWSTAQSAASSQFTKNGIAGATATVTNSTSSGGTASDSVTVSATRAAPSYFAKLFGIGSATITVTSKATIRSYGSVTGSGNVMPWGVMRGNYTLGSSYTIYGDGSSANNGALSINLVSGNSCVAANGANDYKNTINGSSTACTVSVGDQIDTKPGNNTGPTAQGLNARITTWKTFSQIVQLTGNGEYTVLDPSSPQLVLVPVVLNTNGTTTWPNGSAKVQVVGFAWFVITGCGNPSKQGSCSTSDGKYVNGTFVGLSDVNTANATTNWSPSSSSATTVELTG